MYDLGKWIRNRYKSFLPETYSLNDTYVLSSDYDRNIMSAESLLAGLYKPKNGDIWNPDLLWQPIPVHTIPGKYDGVTIKIIHF